MFTDIINLLKFVTDPQTRQTIQAIGIVAARHDKDWLKNIKKMSGKFEVKNGFPDESINVFANSFYSELEGTELSQEKVAECKTVFSELTSNAFRHGCQSKKNCVVHVDCIYSHWFVKIEVRDDGKGFKLEQVLASQAADRKRRTGLQVVRDLADRLSTNQRGNVVTALVASADRITAENLDENYGDAGVSTITLSEQSEWFFLNPDWGPLQKALNRAGQKYVLVTWKTGVRKALWATGKLGKFVDVVTGCRLDSNRYYSFVVNEDWVFQDLLEMKSENVQFFDNERDARAWVLSKISPDLLADLQICAQCQHPNRVKAKWCNYCGSPLAPYRCPRCKYENRIQARFCTSCGNPLMTK